MSTGNEAEIEVFECPQSWQNQQKLITHSPEVLSPTRQQACMDGSSKSQEFLDVSWRQDVVLSLPKTSRELGMNILEGGFNPMEKYARQIASFP